MGFRRWFREWFSGDPANRKTVRPPWVLTVSSEARLNSARLLLGWWDRLALLSRLMGVSPHRAQERFAACWRRSPAPENRFEGNHFAVEDSGLVLILRDRGTTEIDTAKIPRARE